MVCLCFIILNINSWHVARTIITWGEFRSFWSDILIPCIIMLVRTNRVSGTDCRAASFSNEAVNSNTCISICIRTICAAWARMTPSLSWSVSVLLIFLSSPRGHPQMTDTLCCWTLYGPRGLAHFVKDSPLALWNWYCCYKEHLLL